jgi:hypothetical protein
MTSGQQASRTDRGMEGGTAASVSLTRRRWDWYFLPAAAVAAIVGATVCWTTGEVRLLTGPLPLLAVWLCIRVRTPAGGMQTRRVSAIPGAPQLLAWSAIIMVLLVGAIATDIIILGHKLSEPMRFYHVVSCLLLMSLLLGGVWVIEKRYGRRSG